MAEGGEQEEYVRRVLDAYRQTPGTAGTVRRPDRMLAAQLFQRGVSVQMIENALVLAAARRMMRPAEAPPLNTIRSLAYFLPVRRFSNCVSAPSTSTICATSSNASRPPRSPCAPWRGCRKPNRTPAAWMISPAPYNSAEHAFGVDDDPL